MNHALQSERHGDCLFVRLPEYRSADEAGRLMDQAFDQGAACGADRLLVDATAGRVRLSWSEYRRIAGRAVEQTTLRGIQVAAVIREETVPEIQFVQEPGRSRELKYRVFFDRNDAEAWLAR